MKIWLVLMCELSSQLLLLCGIVIWMGFFPKHIKPSRFVEIAQSVQLRFPLYNDYSGMWRSFHSNQMGHDQMDSDRLCMYLSNIGTRTYILVLLDARMCLGPVAFIFHSFGFGSLWHYGASCQHALIEIWVSSGIVAEWMQNGCAMLYKL